MTENIISQPNHPHFKLHNRCNGPWAFNLTNGDDGVFYQVPPDTFTCRSEIETNPWISLLGHGCIVIETKTTGRTVFNLNQFKGFIVDDKLAHSHVEKRRCISEFLARYRHVQAIHDLENRFKVHTFEIFGKSYTTLSF